MKAGIHPEYKLTTIVCACGEVFQTRSTREDIKVGICSKCHPFYTGRSKFVDTAGMVERFKKKYGEEVKGMKPPKKAKPAPVVEPKVEKKPKEVKAAKVEKKPKEAAAPKAEVKTEAKPEVKSEAKSEGK